MDTRGLSNKACFIKNCRPQGCAKFGRWLGWSSVPARCGDASFVAHCPGPNLTQRMASYLRDTTLARGAGFLRPAPAVFQGIRNPEAEVRFGGTGEEFHRMRCKPDAFWWSSDYPEGGRVQTPPPLASLVASHAPDEALRDPFWGADCALENPGEHSLGCGVSGGAGARFLVGGRGFPAALAERQGIPGTG
jgi:hypothetical protein